MRAFDIAVTSIVLIAALGVAQVAIAGSEDAMCEFRKDGDTVNKKSGWCTVSQRQGYVSIDLRNGTSWDLRPAGSANHYRDQDGNKVVRSNQGSEQVYKWDNKKIVVSYPRGYSGNPYGYSSNRHEYRYGNDYSNNYGSTPRNLQDLVGEKAGLAEQAMMARGYKLANSSQSGGSSYSNWRERSTGRCVTARTENGRYRSIVTVPDADCRR
jgi:hypothetical protein